MTVVRDLIKRSVTEVFRRASIKRVNFDGTYESSWLDISPYIVSYGTIKRSFGDEVFLGDYQIDGIDLVIDNSIRKFSDEGDSDSLFSGFRTRYRTKFKVEAGYIDDDGSEVEGIVFYGILYSEPTTSDDGTVKYSVAPLLKVLENETAFGVDTTSTDTETLIDRLVKREKSGIRLFDKFFEGAGDGNKYKINPDSVATTTISSVNIKERDTVWDKISDYSLYDNFFPYVDNTGAFVWDTKDATDSLIYKFQGPGEVIDTAYGVNIISVGEERGGINNIWTRAAIEYSDDAFATSSASWQPGDGSVQDIYGERTFRRDLKELSETEAQGIADSIRTNYQNPKKEWDITTIFIPHLELKDKVQITYQGVNIIENAFTLGSSLLDGSDVLGRRSSSIILDRQLARIIKIDINLDTLVTGFTLREV